MTQQNDSKTTKISDALHDLELAAARANEAISQDETDAPIPWVIEFRVVGSPHILRAPVRELLVMGRKDEAKGILPEIDLGPYDAQKKGVSRKHARLTMRDNRLTIEDLGSSNGTYVNGEVISILHPHRVRDGDHIKLGALSLQVHFVVKPHIDDDTMHGIGNELKLDKIGTGQTILILDEDREVCHIVRYIALQSGFHVKVTHTISDALSEIDAGGIDAMIMEVMMPDGDALNIVDYVRGKDMNLPVIAMTGATGGFQMSQAITSGVDIFIPKPVAVDELARGLANMLKLMS